MGHFRAWPSAQGCGASGTGAEPEHQPSCPGQVKWVGISEGMGAGSREGPATGLVLMRVGCFAASSQEETSGLSLQLPPRLTAQGPGSWHLACPAR